MITARLQKIMCLDVLYVCNSFCCNGTLFASARTSSDLCFSGYKNVCSNRCKPEDLEQFFGGFRHGFICQGGFMLNLVRDILRDQIVQGEIEGFFPK